MKTSAQWWAEVKADPALFNNWLQRQYRGEVTAADRIAEVIGHFASKRELKPEDRATLTTIMKQEAAHAVWIRNLLDHFKVEIKADKENAEKRYWSTQDLSFKDFAKTMAVAAHAEAMRLERIKVIAEDTEVDDYVSLTFKQILTDELFHERAFREMAGNDAMVSTEYEHEEGRRLLGLEA